VSQDLGDDHTRSIDTEIEIDIEELTTPRERGVVGSFESGRPEEAIAALDEARRVRPKSPISPSPRSGLRT
jgi:hypothetical protein